MWPEAHLRCGEREANARCAQRVEDAQLPAHSYDAIPGECVRAAEGPAVHGRLRDAARSAPHQHTQMPHSVQTADTGGVTPPQSLPAKHFAAQEASACLPACMHAWWGQSRRPEAAISGG